MKVQIIDENQASPRRNKNQEDYSPSQHDDDDDDEEYDEESSGNNWPTGSVDITSTS